MNEKKKHYWIYVLELNNQKYYVGLTTQRNAVGRIDQHKNGFYSAQWVKKYGYKSTLQVHDLGLTSEGEAKRTEDILTRDLMQEHGRENVRGGDLSYSGKYFFRFGKVFEDYNWEALTTVVLLMLIILYLAIDKYFLMK